MLSNRSRVGSETNGRSRDGPTWAVEFARFSALSGVVRDDGSGLGKGLKLERARRRAAGQPDLEDSLDIFHTFREGGRALRTTWARPAAPWSEPKRPRRMDRLGRAGESRTGHATRTSRLWRQAEGLWDQAMAAERAWKLTRSAFEFFTPEGRFNDRQQAQAVVAAALPHLSGPAWAKTRRLLLRRESFTFLDQRNGVWLSWDWTPTSCRPCWTWKACTPAWRLSESTPGPAATRAWALARTVQLAKAKPHWQDLAGRVREVLRGVWRASSLVECINSVARMHQGRHRKMTQGLLDLKRLHWDLHQFRAGHRKNQTPYGLLGLKLPALSFWEFLRMTPEELRKQLSATDDVP